MKVPQIGEIVKTDSGEGRVVEVRHWPEMEKEFNNLEEKEDFINRVEHFLGSVDKYFDFTIHHVDKNGVFPGYEILDWSEYKDNCIGQV